MTAWLKYGWLHSAKRLLWILLFTIFCSWAGFFNAVAQETLESDQVRAVAWSPDADKLAVSYQDGRIVIIDLAEQSEPLTFHSDAGTIFTLSWSPDGLYLASGSTSPDNALRVWNVQTGEEIFTAANFGDDILAVAWNPDGSQIIAVTAEGFTDAGNGIVVGVVTREVNLMSFGAVTDIEWSPDGTRIAMTSTGALGIYDAFNFQPLAAYPIDREIYRSGLQNQPVRVSWSPDASKIAIGMGDGRIFLLRGDNAEFLFMLEGSNYQGQERLLGWIYDLHFSSDGQELTSTSGDGSVRVWDMQTGSLLRETQVEQNYAADFSPFGARLALGLVSNPELQSVNQTSQSANLDVLGVDIVVPDPSPERLQAIAEACNAPLPVEQAAASAETAAELATFETAIEALPAETIPPACAADLLAVAQAMQAQ
jgi:WD40 repeat protein